MANKPEPTINASRGVNVPKTAEEVAQLISTLKLQKQAFEAQVSAIGKAVFELAPGYTANDPNAVKRMEALEDQERVTLQHVRLCDASIEQALTLHQVMVEKEAAEAEVARKKNYERALIDAL